MYLLKYCITNMVSKTNKVLVTVGGKMVAAGVHP